MSRPHPLVRLTAVAMALAVALGGLIASGDRIPAPPASVAVDRWTAWSARGGPPGTVMGLVRVVALIGLAYLLLVVLGEIVGRAAAGPAPAVLRLVRQASPPTLTGLVQRMAGVGLAASAMAALVAPGSALAVTPGRAAVAAVAPAASPAPADPPVVMTVTGSSVAGGGPPVMHVLGAAPRSTTVPPASTPTTTRPAPPGPSAASVPVHPDGPPAPAPGPRSATPAPAPTALAPPPAEAAVWVIAPGDHLWRVSSETLRSAWNRVPTDSETARYLQAVIAANRPVLVVPDHPDLVYPGQRFTLPPVPTA